MAVWHVMPGASDGDAGPAVDEAPGKLDLRRAFPEA